MNYNLVVVVVVAVLSIMTIGRAEVVRGRKSGFTSFPRVGRSGGIHTWDKAAGGGPNRATIVLRPSVGRGHPSADVDAATTAAQSVWANSLNQDFMDLAEKINKGSIPLMPSMYRRDKRSAEEDKQTNGGAKRDEKSLVFYPRIGRGFFPIPISSDNDGISPTINDVWPAQRIEDLLEFSERMNAKSSFLPVDDRDQRRVTGGGWLMSEKPNTRSRFEFIPRPGRVSNEEPDYEINGGGGYEDKV